MSSLPIPQTAPFEDEEIAILNRVVGPASPTQRSWLAGFLAGLDAGAGMQPQPAAAPKKAEPLTILFASESGNCERLATDMGKVARKQGFKPNVVDLADIDVAELAKAGKLIVIAATWGEGEPPGRAVEGYEALMSEGAPRLDGVEFGVLALGDTAYVEFCAVGKAIDARLEALGAKRAVERVDCDLDFETPAADWVKGALKALEPKDEGRGSVISVDFGHRHDTDGEAGISEAVGEVIEHINLNSSRSDKETIHLELGFEDGVPSYEPGDSLDLHVENDPALVENVLEAAGLGGDEALKAEIVTGRDVATLSAKTLEAYAVATGHPQVAALLESGEARGWIADRQLVDLLEAYPAALTRDDLLAVTRPLAPRAYSIASSRKEFEDEAHLLIAAVRYEAHGRARKGVASCHIAERVKKGAQLKVKLRANRHFRLPDPASDVIMVGPGTGVAPFRAFVQERRAVDAPGRNWLFYGDRRFTHDFLYQLEWQEALKEGSLDRIDLAFSRDRPERVYVQDRIRERQRDVVDWLEGGAHFYVCGDAKAMAKDVRAALVSAFAEVKDLSAEKAEEAVRGLEKAKRYLTDTY